MVCEAWKEQLIAELYGELGSEHDREALRAHLRECLGCREELEDLSAARSALRATDLPVPAAPRIVLFPAARRRAALPFAAGFAAAALLAVGVLGGFALRGASPAAPPGPSAAAGVSGADRAAMEAVVQAALEEQRRSFEQALAQRPLRQGVTRDELETMLAASERRVDQRRATDMRYLLGEIGAAEMRAGASIGETQRALQYVALANNPDASLH